MADPQPHAKSGIRLFEVVAKDGRRVRLHEIWYHHHILGRKHEIAGLPEPLDHIQRALIEAEEVNPTRASRFVYIGPPIERGFYRDYCLHVYVQPEKPDRGFVLTVVMHKAKGFY